MSRRKRKAYPDENLAAELGSEDGSDPREFHSKPWNAPKKATRKGQQLCGQVKEALSLILPTCSNSALQEATVVAVEPAPNTARLLVLVRIPEDADRDWIVLALGRAKGFLRQEIAASICRRQAPDLIFEVFAN
jgi:ribosome-binding factor A